MKVLKELLLFLLVILAFFPVILPKTLLTPHESINPLVQSKSTRYKINLEGDDQLKKMSSASHATKPRHGLSSNVSVITNGITVMLAKNVLQKGEPVEFSISFEMPAQSFLNASILLVLEPTSFLEAHLDDWPLNMTIIPITNQNISNEENTSSVITINGQFGPHVTDAHTGKVYALNALNNGYEPHGIPSWAKYKILKVEIHNETEQGDRIYKSSENNLSLEFEVQSFGENVLFVLTLVDDAFLNEYGDPTIVLNESSQHDITYQNRTISLWDEWKFKFQPFVANWTINEPLNLSTELPRLLTLAQDVIGLSSRWKLVDGTAPQNHGFDDVMGLTGQENVGDILGGLAYVNSNALVAAGGWNDFITVTYSRDTMEKVITHEFIHNIGFGHVPQFGWLMSAQIGGWRMHDTTYRLINESKDQFDGILYRSPPIGPPTFTVNGNTTYHAQEDFVISWSTNPKQLGGAITRYELQWSTSRSFQATNTKKILIEKDQQHVVHITTPGIYFFRIKSINKWNMSSNWSEIIQLEILPNPNPTMTESNGANTTSTTTTTIAITTSTQSVTSSTSLNIGMMVMLAAGMFSKARRQKKSKRTRPVGFHSPSIQH